MSSPSKLARSSEAKVGNQQLQPSLLGRMSPVPTTVLGRISTYHHLRTLWFDKPLPMTFQPSAGARLNIVAGPVTDFYIMATLLDCPQTTFLKSPWANLKLFTDETAFKEMYESVSSHMVDPDAVGLVANYMHLSATATKADSGSIEVRIRYGLARFLSVEEAQNAADGPHEFPAGLASDAKAATAAATLAAARIVKLPKSP
jgi:hypothetical protein